MQISRAVGFVIVALLAGAWLALPMTVQARTYYVRVDGGTASQCNGTADAAFAGSSHHACAWKTPAIALPMGDGQYGNMIPVARIKGGDTLVIASGSYMIGYSEAPVAGTQGQACGRNNPYECSISNIPSGIDAAHPTVITGDCAKPPELWGTQRLSSIFNLSGQHDVTIACLTLTDHANCITFYKPDPAFRCNRDRYPYGTWADTGIHADHVRNLTLKNLDIHGFGNYGLQAGALSGDTLLDDVTIRGNGWGGFNGDLGGNNDQSSSSGTITIRDSEISWNGCTEDYPSTRIINCWAQQEGGYGDGLGLARTGGVWNIINTKVIGNTSDGLDLLYADGSGHITIDGVTAMWNAGNQIKISGNATIRNSVVVGACDYLRGHGAMSDGDLCRAAGAALSLSFTATNQAILVEHNTVAGGGDCIINGGTHGGFSSPDKSDVYTYRNNIFLGAPYFRAGRDACLAWYSDALINPYTIRYDNNIVWKVKDGVCPSGNICKDPLLKNEALAHFDPTPLPGSPAIGAAYGSACPAHSGTDVKARGAACNIGAVQ